MSQRVLVGMGREAAFDDRTGIAVLEDICEQSQAEGATQERRRPKNISARVRVSGWPWPNSVSRYVPTIRSRASEIAAATNSSNRSEDSSAQCRSSNSNNTGRPSATRTNSLAIVSNSLQRAAPPSGIDGSGSADGSFL